MTGVKRVFVDIVPSTGSLETLNENNRKLEVNGDYLGDGSAGFDDYIDLVVTYPVASYTITWKCNNLVNYREAQTIVTCNWPARDVEDWGWLTGTEESVKSRFPNDTAAGVQHFESGRVFGGTKVLDAAPLNNILTDNRTGTISVIIYNLEAATFHINDPVVASGRILWYIGEDIGDGGEPNSMHLNLKTVQDSNDYAIPNFMLQGDDDGFDFRIARVSSPFQNGYDWKITSAFKPYVNDNTLQYTQISVSYRPTGTNANWLPWKSGSFDGQVGSNQLTDFNNIWNSTAGIVHNGLTVGGHQAGTSHQRILNNFEFRVMVIRDCLVDGTD